MGVVGCWFTMPLVRLPWIAVLIVLSTLFGTSRTQRDDHVDKKPPSRLPSGVDDSMIAKDLGKESVSKRRHIIKTGSGSFRRIREEDRAAADLALRLLGLS